MSGWTSLPNKNGKEKQLIRQRILPGLILSLWAFAFVPCLFAGTSENAEPLQANVAASVSGDCPRTVPGGLPSLAVTRGQSSAARNARMPLNERALFEAWCSQPAGGEAAGDTICHPTQSVFHAGNGEHGKNPFSRTGGEGAKATFGTDKLVRDKNKTSTESHPAMASDPDGNLWCVFEDNFFGYQTLNIYWSNDGGENWLYYGFIESPGFNLREPSIAVGSGTRNSLLIAYIRDDGSQPRPIVATAPLHTTDFTFQSVPIWYTWEAYAKPVIWTDSTKYNSWYAYLTCEGIYEAATDNINVVTWRSTDLGHTWGDTTALLGMYDDDAWSDPDGGFGTSENRLFLTCFNDTDDSIYCVRGGTGTGAWEAEEIVYTLTEMPNNAVDPEIEAAVFDDNVLICCTKSYNNIDNVGTSWSSNCGDTWGYLYSLSGYTTNAEHSPALHANCGGASWHLVFTGNGRCFYSSAPQDYSNVFQATPTEVNDNPTVSIAHTKKGITSTWHSDAVSIAWTDYRDGPPDYDTYFDRADDFMRNYVPEQYTTIQDAINHSGPHQLIHVNEGTYAENLVFNGVTAQLRSVFGPEVTAIDGKGYGVTCSFKFGETSETVLEGFTIQNGDIHGISCVYDSYPIIRGNIIKDNTALNQGGGISINGSNPLIISNVIMHNHVYGSEGGGIMVCNGASPRIISNVIANNSCMGSGGGIASEDSSPYIYNNTIAYNTSNSKGGGLAMYGDPKPIIRNTIIWGNTASEYPQIRDHGTTAAQIEYCDVQGGWAGGVNCIDADPRFENGAAEDYRLSRFSPCINMGTDSMWITMDAVFRHRPFMGTNDMGAYEFYDAHTFAANRFTIVESARTKVTFELRGGAENKNRQYMIFGGMTGTTPGTPLPLNGPTLPVNFDIFTNFVLDLINTTVFWNFSGLLNTHGDAIANIDTLAALPPGMVGARMYFAYACPYQHPDGWFASNPVTIEIVP